MLIFPLNLQTITITLDFSNGGEGVMPHGIGEQALGQ